jgi:hypothetical protein
MLHYAVSLCCSGVDMSVICSGHVQAKNVMFGGSCVTRKF